jgi:3-hydroxyisobutyrate dehydrogenase
MMKPSTLFTPRSLSACVSDDGLQPCTLDVSLAGETMAGEWRCNGLVREGVLKMQIGWIGTGVMGASMAGHLMRAGHTLAVFSRTRARAQELIDHGATWADTPRTLAGMSDVIFTMVGYPSDVEDVYLGARGVLSGARSGSLAVDLTTSSPSLARRLAVAGRERGVDVLDAPVSGGDIGARNASLSIMVGGERRAFDRALPLLEHMGKTIVLQGPSGSGQHTKMVNQILIAGTMVGAGEAITYARAAGLDLTQVLGSVGGGAAASWTLQNLVPRIIRGDMAPGFYVEHFIKDMGIALAEAEAMRLSLPGLALAKQLYQTVIAYGGARNGTQAIVLALEAMNGGGRAPSLNASIDSTAAAALE